MKTINIKRILGIIAISMPMTLTAQTATTLCTFEKALGVEYDSLSIYDPFETSPFHSGALKGNFAVTANPVIGVGDSTAHVLALQRSRFGSIRYGVKIKLRTPFALEPTSKYIHVLIYKPVAGRVMLIGLGKRDNRPGESDLVPQFAESALKAASPSVWQDNVFAVSGNGGITISSLVVVPDAESRHDLDNDFAAYIDNIILNDSPTPLIGTSNYPVNFSETAKMTRTDRYLGSITLTGSMSGKQTINTGNSSGNSLMYVKSFSRPFVAVAGETLTPSFGYTGNGMHGYVYMDYDQDGKFSATLNGNVPTAGTDLKSFSCYNRFNSAGTSLSNENQGFSSALPSFTIPATLPNGFYRIRYKVDWNNIDAGGNISRTNSIISNGGAIVDARINVHAATCPVAVTTRNGVVLKTGNTELNGTRVTFGKAFTIKLSPAPGFKQNGITLRHGYLSNDSLIHGTPQWETVVIPASSFVNNSYTIPASYVDGELNITAEFAELPTSISSATTDVKGNTKTLQHRKTFSKGRSAGQRSH